MQPFPWVVEWHPDKGIMRESGRSKSWWDELRKDYWDKWNAQHTMMQGTILKHGHKVWDTDAGEFDEDEARWRERSENGKGAFVKPPSLRAEFPRKGYTHFSQWGAEGMHGGTDSTGAEEQKEEQTGEGKGEEEEGKDAAETAKKGTAGADLFLTDPGDRKLHTHVSWKKYRPTESAPPTGGGTAHGPRWSMTLRDGVYGPPRLAKRPPESLEARRMTHFIKAWTGTITSNRCVLYEWVRVCGYCIWEGGVSRTEAPSLPPNCHLP